MFESYQSFVEAFLKDWPSQAFPENIDTQKIDERLPDAFGELEFGIEQGNPADFARGIAECACVLIDWARFILNNGDDRKTFLHWLFHRLCDCIISSGRRLVLPESLTKVAGEIYLADRFSLAITTEPHSHMRDTIATFILTYLESE